jgi:toxin ParE1/3/4
VARIEWTEDAHSDFEAIYYFIAHDDPNYADLFRTSVLDKVRLSSRFPEMGRLSIFSNDPNDRELFVFSYRIVYNFSNDIVTILTIIHTSRKP